jgi:hypothetical protein
MRDLAGIAQIGGHEPGRTAVVLDLLDNAGASFGVAAGDDHRGTEPGQGRRSRLTDAGGGPGHQGCLYLEFYHAGTHEPLHLDRLV